MVARYRDLQPHTEVRLRLSDHILDIVREGVDLAIRLARMENSSFTLRKVAEVERVLCAAPAYLARRGAPEAPARPFAPRLPAAALSRLAAIPLDARLSRRIRLRPDRGPASTPTTATC